MVLSSKTTIVGTKYKTYRELDIDIVTSKRIKDFFNYQSIKKIYFFKLNFTILTNVLSCLN